MSTMTWTTLSTSADMMDSTPKEQQPPVRFANNDSPHTMNGEIAISKMTDDFIPANVSNSSSTPKTTFYRRSLPDTCIAFSSKQGRKFFESAMKNHGLKSYFHLMEQYTTQSEPAFCGISTLVIALNALAVDPRQIWKGSWRWYEESMLNCCIDLEQAKDTGITMSTFNCLSLCQGLSTEMHYVDGDAEKNSSSLENFRTLVIEACVDTNDADNHDNDDQNMYVDRVLIASYSRRILKQTGSGHFSPIAAYDQESDSVLIMDTARFKYGAHWVKIPLLYEAMQPVDPDTGRSRGYVMLIHRKEEDTPYKHRLPNLPMAILLRSEMKQTESRRTFKNYLATLKSGNRSYCDILHYFSKDGSSKSSIWEMIMPQLRPYDGDIDSKEMVDELRSLIRLLWTAVKATDGSRCDIQNSSHCQAHFSVDDSSHCRANHCRTIPLRTEEATLIVYLACLEVNERESIIFNPEFQSSTTERSRLQLLAEAELVRYAIDTSDQIPTAMGTSIASIEGY